MRLTGYLTALGLALALAGAGFACGEGEDCTAQCAGSPDPADCEQQCLPIDTSSDYPEEDTTQGEVLSPTTAPGGSDDRGNEPADDVFD
jgi:hypothetical protein